MKTIHILNNVIRCKATGVIAILALLFLPMLTNAQLPVTKVYTPHTVSPTTTTTYSGTGATGDVGTGAGSGLTGNTYNYKFGVGVSGANIAVLDSFQVNNSLNYHYQPTTNSVKFRRVDGVVTGLRKSLRIEYVGGAVGAGGTVSCYINYNDSLEDLFSQRIFNVGIDNVFQNSNATNNINIERMDDIFPLGVKATDNTKAGFAVFDWGNAGGHDPFYIAAISKLDASGNPSVYYPAIAAVAGNYGSAQGGVADYVIMRKNYGEAHLLLMASGSSQDRDGVFFRFSDLGVPNNTVIYGYSIFSSDVLVSPVGNMVNYNNTTNFPAGTNLGGGGLDPLAVMGLWVSNATFVTLPDRVNDLHTTLVNDEVKLNWDLQNSSDLKEQVIERSFDGTNYSAIIHMPVQTAGAQTALDSRPLNGVNYYRLKLVQQDGTVAAYSPVNRIDLKAVDASAMDVYPNPVKNKLLNVDIHSLNGSGKLIVFNMSGRVVMQQSVTGEQAVQTTLHLPGTMPTGTYILKLTDNSGNKLSERQIIVE